MGFDVAVVRVLLALPRLGVDFSRTVMIGRQFVYMDAGQLARELRRAGYRDARKLARELLQENAGYAEPLLRMLGARTVESLDVSGYEGASLLHDLNTPLPTGWPPPFTLVIDSGTLEHVFAATTALRNLSDLTASNGHVVVAVPANNQLGHGFYQFGPEFFYGGFGARSGFEVRRMYLATRRALRLTFFSIPPSSTHRRLQSRARGKAELIVIAKRMPGAERRDALPAQSNYEACWAENENLPGPGAIPRMHRRHGIWPQLYRAAADAWWTRKGRGEFPPVDLRREGADG